MLRRIAPLLIVVVASGCTSASIGDPGEEADASAHSPDAAAFVPDAQRAIDAAIQDAVPLADRPPCVDGELNTVDPVSGSCYMYFSAEVPWSVALAACGAFGDTSHLAVITSAEEQAVVASIGAPVADVWLGGSDQVTEMSWQWATGEAMGYTNWRAGEPNDSNGEDCMIMEVDVGGTWDDRGCGKTYGYYCERN